MTTPQPFTEPQGDLVVSQGALHASTVNGASVDAHSLAVEHSVLVHAGRVVKSATLVVNKFAMNHISAASFCCANLLCDKRLQLGENNSTT